MRRNTSANTRKTTAAIRWATASDSDSCSPATMNAVTMKMLKSAK
jgi:hypothetical protein